MSVIGRRSEGGWSSSPSGLGPSTLVMDQAADHIPPGADATETEPRYSAQGSQYWIIAFIAGLVALWFLHQGSQHLQGNAIAVNAFNFITVFFMAALGFILAKLFLSYVPVPGLTALVHAM